MDPNTIANRILAAFEEGVRQGRDEALAELQHRGQLVGTAFARIDASGRVTPIDNVYLLKR